MRREVIDGAAADMGKGRINITKGGDFHFSSNPLLFHNMKIDTKHEKKCENFLRCITGAFGQFLVSLL